MRPRPARRPSQRGRWGRWAPEAQPTAEMAARRRSSARGTVPEQEAEEETPWVAPEQYDMALRSGSSSEESDAEVVPVPDAADEWEEEMAAS
eukprot:293829-Lingulodinium_polyedra.AAC.1